MQKAQKAEADKALAELQSELRIRIRLQREKRVEAARRSHQAEIDKALAEEWVQQAWKDNDIEKEQKARQAFYDAWHEAECEAFYEAWKAAECEAVRRAKHRSLLRPKMRAKHGSLLQLTPI